MRFKWRDYAFDLPPGFEIQPAFVPGREPCPTGIDRPPSATAPAGCLILRKPAASPPGRFPISKNPEDLDPRAAGATIVLTTLLARYVGPPLRHLQQTVRVLPDYLEKFKVNTCEKYRVGDLKAARAHYSFVTNFRLDHFVIAWQAADKVITATMTIPECDPDDGWAILQPFVDTFEF